TITDRSALSDAIDAIREADVGIDDGEFIDGVICISVPVRTPKGRVIGGIAVMAPQARVDLERAKSFEPDMRDAADRLGATFAKAT
ncbi:MAG: IclR family transcriptional regulator C-terminal domain-containing protein, partial [Pseudomonadota bacterium]